MRGFNFLIEYMISDGYNQAPWDNNKKMKSILLHPEATRILVDGWKVRRIRSRVNCEVVWIISAIVARRETPCWEDDGDCDAAASALYRCCWEVTAPEDAIELGKWSLSQGERIVG